MASKLLIFHTIKTRDVLKTLDQLLPTLCRINIYKQLPIYLIVNVYTYHINVINVIIFK